MKNFTAEFEMRFWWTARPVDGQNWIQNQRFQKKKLHKFTKLSQSPHRANEMCENVFFSLFLLPSFLFFAFFPLECRININLLLSYCG